MIHSNDLICLFERKDNKDYWFYPSWIRHIWHSLHMTRISFFVLTVPNKCFANNKQIGNFLYHLLKHICFRNRQKVLQQKLHISILWFVEKVKRRFPQTPNLGPFQNFFAVSLCFIFKNVRIVVWHLSTPIPILKQTCFCWP